VDEYWHVKGKAQLRLYLGIRCSAAHILPLQPGFVAAHVHAGRSVIFLPCIARSPPDCNFPPAVSDFNLSQILNNSVIFLPCTIELSPNRNFPPAVSDFNLSQILAGQQQPTLDEGGATNPVRLFYKSGQAARLCAALGGVTRFCKGCGPPSQRACFWVKFAASNAKPHFMPEADLLPLSLPSPAQMWLAPEVLSFNAATTASDVYAFGLTMCELLTWRLPFVGLTPFQASTRSPIAARPARQPAVACYRALSFQPFPSPVD